MGARTGSVAGAVPARAWGVSLVWIQHALVESGGREWGARSGSTLGCMRHALREAGGGVSGEEGALSRYLDFIVPNGRIQGTTR